MIPLELSAFREMYTVKEIKKPYVQNRQCFMDQVGFKMDLEIQIRFGKGERKDEAIFI